MPAVRKKKSSTELGRIRRTDLLFEQVTAEDDDDRRRALVNDVVVANLPVARSIAWRFRGRGCALDDLEQTAYMALVRAAQDFDPARGHHFLTYAVPCITGAVKKYFRDSGWTVRPPRMVQELQQRLEAAGRTVDPETGSTPTPSRLAELLGVPQSDVDEALSAQGCFTPASLDVPLGEGDGPSVLGDLLVATDDPAIGAVEARLTLLPALSRLSPEDRSVLTMRFVEERTQQQMAEALGTSQPAVSRLLGRILDQMQAMVLDAPGSADPAA